MKRKMLLPSVILMSVVFLAGCASITTINSNPSGAELWLDGMRMGTTPYTHSDTDISFSSKTVQLRLAGYRDFTGAIKRDKVNTQNAILSFLCFWPTLLWSWEYPPSYTFDLQKNTAGLFQMDYEFTPEFIAGL
ncbi:MAG: PEGA domain-containing protein [bacterium]